MGLYMLIDLDLTQMPLSLINPTFYKRNKLRKCMQHFSLECFTVCSLYREVKTLKCMKL